MGQFRRAPPIVLALATCASANHASGDPLPSADLALVLPGDAGRLDLVNRGTRPLLVERAITVQRRTAAGWVPIETEFNAVAICTRRPGVEPVSIPASGTLAVQRWRGFTCGGQCQGTCRRNIYHGAGPFRFVVTMLPNRRQVTSASFTMPASHVPTGTGGPFRILPPPR